MVFCVYEHLGGIMKGGRQGAVCSSSLHSVKIDSKAWVPHALKFCLLTRPYVWNRLPCPQFCGLYGHKF